MCIAQGPAIITLDYLWSITLPKEHVKFANRLAYKRKKEIQNNFLRTEINSEYLDIISHYM
jgi:hypothetical protein